jgi:hypothetical protein
MDELSAALARIASLEAEVEAAKTKAAKQATATLRLKVSDKGGVSVYGLNSRFPLTLYANQWSRLADFIPTVLDFCLEHVDKLSFKDAPAKAVAVNE